MILVDNEILELVRSNKLILENFNEENLQSASYDITISNYIYRFRDVFKKINIHNRSDVDNLYQKVNIENGYDLRPNETIFVQVNEVLNMPKFLVAHVRPRTTFIRLGLILSHQHVNPTYKGRLSLALFNSSPYVIEISPNLKVGQLVFEKLSNLPTENKLYANNPKSKYQNEEEFITSKAYLEFDETIEDNIVENEYNRILKKIKNKRKNDVGEGGNG